MKTRRQNATGTLPVLFAIFVMVLGFDLSSGGVSVVLANKIDQEQAPEPAEEAEENVLSHSGQALDLLDAAIKALQSDDFDRALTAYDQIVNAPEAFNSFDVAIAHKMRGMANVAMEDYKAALADLRDAIVHPSLPQEYVSELQLVAARVTFLQGRTGETISFLEDWFAEVEGPETGALFFAAQAYLEVNRLAEAERFVELGLATMEPEAAEAGFYAIAVAVYLRQKKFDEALPLLRTMELRWPTGS